MAATGETDEFPVKWDDPADADLTWAYNPMHQPDVKPPLELDLVNRPFMQGFGMALTELGFETEIRTVQANYYIFSNWATPPGGPPPAPSFDELVNKVSSHGRRWREEILPEVLELIDYYRRTDFDAMPEADLVAELDKLQETRVRVGVLHTRTTRPWIITMEQFVDTYKELTGKDDLSATRLLQGFGNKSVEAGNALWKLSKLAASIPYVSSEVRRLPRTPTHEVLSNLEGEQEARPFLEELASFLEAYGWRVDLLGFSTPTWQEDPTIPLIQMQKYMDMDQYDPVAEQGRLADERDAAIKETMEALDEDARAKLQTILDIAHDINPVLEDHNFYIDQRLSTTPRRLVLAAGRRLVSMGSAQEPDDVLYLHLDELKSALLGERSDSNEIVSRRKEEMQVWSKVTPPATIGAEPSPNARRRTDRFAGLHDFKADQPNLLLGNGGSAGVAQGTARILWNLSEVSRLQPGDVLVARTTMPPWTPLFAIASAIVVETGGILSHAAITAREYGKPAVLGVKDATTIIRDGQLLEVDGSRGRVRIIS